MTTYSEQIISGRCRYYAIVILIFLLLFSLCSCGEPEPTSTEKPTIPTVYQKLNSGSDIRILVVGDSIGAGSGATAPEYQWDYRLKSWLETEYSISVSITNVSMGGNSSFAGYTRVWMLPDTADFDLAIVCYGQNDSDQDFDLYYETLLRAIQCDACRS